MDYREHVREKLSRDVDKKLWDKIVDSYEKGEGIALENVENALNNESEKIIAIFDELIEKLKNNL
jgi:hypothetical protein